MSYFRIALVAIIGFVVVACQKKPAHSSNTYDFTQPPAITTRIDKINSLLELTIDLPNEVHAYAPGEKIGKPIDLTISTKNGWVQRATPIIPAGEKKDLGSLGETHVLTGKITVKQKLTIGDGEGEALLYLQICTEHACDRPRIHNLVLQP